MLALIQEGGMILVLRLKSGIHVPIRPKPIRFTLRLAIVADMILICPQIGLQDEKF